ncbi:MAG: NAD(P)H-binding protein [Holophagaceae bacterium]|uniref:NAD(P)H-binding protein n=1 Tax=Candidatus Geothrix skivensis TaxID=2954439 RepID=A0A9D7SFP2_9BACT|nr:NAD(P)H-binding protein [Candidatus Geothrix skivensis]
MTHPEPPVRPRIAIAGTSSFIGAAVCRALAPRFEVVALTRSMALPMSDGGEGIEVRPCDHFSRRELAAALEGVDYAIYLVHNRDPSARLDQAQSRDMDLLVADNFAWAAARAGVKQILCRAPLGRGLQHDSARHAEEMQEVLRSHGVPLTVLRTGLVLGPGGDLSRLLASLVRRLPVIPLPRLAETKCRPIQLEGFLTAIRHCVGQPGTFGQAYDVFGPEAITLRWMLQETATLLGRPARFFSWPAMPRGLFLVLLRLLRPSLHPDFLAYLLDMFSGDATGQANPVERQVAQSWRPLQETLAASVQGTRPGSAVRSPQRTRDDEVLRQMRRVRSIQRLRLPEGRNAQWLADHYFRWLGTLMGLFIRTERDGAGSWSVRQRPGGLRLLELSFQPTHSTPDRRMYFITGGALARFLGGRTARLEFRDLLGGRYSMFAIHDFDPSLPWVFYRFTQALIHALVMKGFQGHMEQLAEGGPRL